MGYTEETAMEESAQAEMPRYRSHKSVHALKLKSILPEEGGVLSMTPEDPRFKAIRLEGAEADRFRRACLQNIEDCGYLVVYTDGYRSWSPTTAFEEGYTLE